MARRAAALFDRLGSVKALVSIHDVMPHTLDRVKRILDWLEQRRVSRVTLLVVPGKPWTEKHIHHLRDWAAAGHELAAHGWHHQTRPRRLYHRLHALLLSRNVAEHLDLDSTGILDLMVRSRNWFAENELPAPDFYVPPAWALGPISKADLAKVPFRVIETTRGFLLRENHDSAPSRVRWSLRRLPLTGYEADTRFREAFLRWWNALQAKRAQRKKLPLRISIHPDDLELRIADQMAAQVSGLSNFLLIRDVFFTLSSRPARPPGRDLG